jgi:hypothetical protein
MSQYNYVLPNINTSLTSVDYVPSDTPCKEYRTPRLEEIFVIISARERERNWHLQYMSERRCEFD